MIIRDDEFYDLNRVPESKGIPPYLFRVAAVGLIGIFVIGAAVVLLSGYGHIWPAIQTTRVDLGTR